MKKILLPIWIVLCVLLYSCKDNVVCPAFQSTYILDDSIRMARYSLFLNDSTPKYTASSRRSKYGVNRKTNHFIKNYEMMTAPKKNVLGPPRKDSLYYHAPEETMMASVAGDSLGGDSTRVTQEFAVVEDDGPKYKYRYHPNNAYNQEQEYYNKYYGELFIDNRPPPPTPEDLENAELEKGMKGQAWDTTNVEVKKKGLFKKKDKEVENEGQSEVDQDTLKKAQEKPAEDKPTEEVKPEEEAPAPTEEDKPEE